MNHSPDLPERFLCLLTGETSEAERLDFERAILEDDELFQQLAVLENELVDAFVNRELDAESSRQIGKRIAVSPRLQAMAETTLALTTWYGARSTGYSPEGEEVKTGPPTISPRWRRRLAIGMALVALVGSACAATMYVATLNRSVRDIERELAELKRETRAIEETVAGLRDLNQTLVLRVARMEAAAKH